ncbi:alpha/beta hydrolase [Bacteroides sp.]|uniref:alpha/beta fold hydrolase n=1 Tax=Bacteroides sp. TaxID=29523 RepID=UPI0026377D30|nr:alpha/beta hydrolase [Bacteroides sp.]MDD3036587.1 alpha/beta hydrolase [Bacteroides sp.]
MKKILKVLTWMIGCLIGLIVILLLSIWIYSGNTPEGKTLIAQKGDMKIGGIKQGYFIRSENERNPVILFLHGGPGSPELPMIKDTQLEQYFTVCYWDQRGAGMTFSSDTDPATMTIDQFVEDTRQMTDSLRKWYGMEKIYLMGHSWGSYLGIKTIEKYPELYHAYIGIGQVCNQLESERQAYDYIVSEARKADDKKTIEAFELYDKYADDFPSNDYLLKVRTNSMNKYGVGIKHKDISMFDIAIDLLYYRGYTLEDKLNYLQGTMFSLNNMFHRIIEDNLFETSTRFEIPVYILQGKYDYQVSYQLAKEYSDSIDAPKKDFFTFEESAHSPNLEEPQRFVEIVKSIAYNHDAN